jgi:hypothetical protein
MDTNLQIIKKAIKAAGGSDRGSLADVLVAIENKKTRGLYLEVGMDGRFWISANVSPAGWNLLKDRLEDQTDETLEFIANLLR